MTGNSQLNQTTKKLNGHLSALSEDCLPESGAGRKRQLQRGMHENKGPVSYLFDGDTFWKCLDAGKTLSSFLEKKKKPLC